jgi:23S rRNA-/tRNA-specific pseudouridylate synthase
MFTRPLSALQTIRKVTSGAMKRGRPSATAAASSSATAAVEETETPVVIDDPYWGSPDACSVADLLSKTDQSKAILHCSDDYLVLNKPADLRMDGPFRATVHKLLTYWYPPPSVLQLVSTATDSATDNKKEKNANRDDDLLMEHILTLHRHNDVTDNELRPCHQLDYATSGVLLVARNAIAADNARIAFEGRLAKKQYLAVLHGHVAIHQEWPLLLPETVESTIESLEVSYRRERGKRRKDTWSGYQPAHALFQQWKQQQRKPQKAPKNYKNYLPDESWQAVWGELQLDESELETMRGWNWNDIKAAQQKAPFERAAVVYNRLQLERNDCVDASSSVAELPTFFRVQGDCDETFYVFAALAQPKDDFAMRIHPKLKDVSSSCNLLAGDTDMDYKPSLTKVTVQSRTQLKGQHVTKVCLEPRTGRRHQLRVHSALVGHAIVGDQTYELPGGSDISERMCLHSFSLEIPLLGKNYKFAANDPFANDSM